MIEGVVHFGTELWNTLVGAWTAFSGLLEGFADMGITPVVELINGYCASGGACQEATALSMVFAGLYLAASTAPSLVFGYFLFKSFLGDRKKAVAGTVAYKALSIGVVGYWLQVRPTPDEIYARLSYGPVTVVDSVMHLFSTGDFPQIFTVTVTFLAFVALAWGMFYAINLLTYFVGILVRPNPPWSQSSGKGHALMYTIAWMFFMTMSDPATAFVNVMILNIVVLWRRAEWRESKQESESDLTADTIAAAINKADTSSSGGDVPDGTSRIDYRRK